MEFEVNFYLSRPHWDPASSPPCVVAIHHSFPEEFYSQDHTEVKHLRIELATGDSSARHGNNPSFNVEEAAEELCACLDDSWNFRKLEHVQISDVGARTGNYGATIPPCILRTVSGMNLRYSIGFRCVELPLDSFTHFLRDVAAPSLALFLVDVAASEERLIPARFVVSKKINHLDLRGVGERLAKAILIGAFENGRDDVGFALRLALHPDLITQDIWAAIEPRFGACRIFEIHGGNPFFTERHPCTLFHRLTTVPNINQILELRLTRAMFTKETYLSFLVFLERAHHLQCLRITGWTSIGGSVPGTPEDYDNNDMTLLFSALSRRENGIRLVFTDAPFKAIISVCEHFERISFTLLQLQVVAPVAHWYQCEQDSIIRHLAADLVDKAVRSTTIGVIEDPDVHERAMVHCNGGMAVEVKDRQFTTALEDEQMRQACIRNYTNYELRHAADNQELRRLMQPLVRGRRVDIRDRNVAGQGVNLGGVDVVSPERTTADRVLHYGSI